MMLPVARGFHPSHQLAEQILCFPEGSNRITGEMSQTTPPAERNGWLSRVGSVSLPVPDHPTIPFHVLILVCHGGSAADTIAMADLGKIKQDRATPESENLENFPTQPRNEVITLLNCFIQHVVPGYQVFHWLRPQDHRVLSGLDPISRHNCPFPNLQMTRATELFKFLELMTKLPLLHLCSSIRYR